MDFELTANRRYTIAYLMGTPDFEKRMYDVYIGMNNNRRPPFLDDIFSGSTQMQALLLLTLGSKESWFNISERRWKELYEAVWNDEEYAKIEVFQMSPDYCAEEIYGDIFQYLDKNRMSFLVRDNHLITSRKSQLVNSPVLEIW